MNTKCYLRLCNMCNFVQRLVSIVEIFVLSELRCHKHKNSISIYEKFIDSVD